jgi:hypothetical protein
MPNGQPRFRHAAEVGTKSLAETGIIGISHETDIPMSQLDQVAKRKAGTARIVDSDDRNAGDSKNIHQHDWATTLRRKGLYLGVRFPHQEYTAEAESFNFGDQLLFQNIVYFALDCLDAIGCKYGDNAIDDMPVAVHHQPETRGKEQVGRGLFYRLNGQVAGGDDKRFNLFATKNDDFDGTRLAQRTTGTPAARRGRNFSLPFHRTQSNQDSAA